MPTIEASRSVLVLVDYPARLMPAIDRAESVVGAAVLVADAARALGIQVVGTEQNRRGLGPNDERVLALCEHTVSKMHFNAADDGLTGWLRQRNPAIDQVVVAGCEAHVCLMQSALGLLRDGLRVCVAADDGLTGWLRQRNPAIDQVVVAGCEAHVCLMQSALGLLRDGLRVCVAADACGSRRPDDKALALQRLAHSGALLVSSEMVVFEWLRSCSEPPFKAVLQLVKQYGA